MAEYIQCHLENPCLNPMGVQIGSTQQPHEQELNQPKCVQEQLSNKNRLQEFTQRAGLPLPIYHTTNENGPRHPPIYRATVEVDGEKYASLNTFSTRKAAEQDAAKLALESISYKIKKSVSTKSTDGGFPPIYEDKVFCKSILHEFAAKTNKQKPTYDTVRLEGLVPVFVSSLVFDGSKYTGGTGTNKKEAEQLAARAAILSILGKSESVTVLSEIVKAKGKLIGALHDRCNVDSCVPHAPNPVSNIGSCVGKEIIADDAQQTGDLVENVGQEALQQQLANNQVTNSVNSTGSRAGKEVITDDQQTGVLIENVGAEALKQQLANNQLTVSNNANEAGNMMGNVVWKVLQLESPIQVRHELGKPISENFPQNCLLPITFVPELRAQTAGKEIVADDALDGGDLIQQQSANKKVRVSNDTNEASNAIGNGAWNALLLQSPVRLIHESGKLICENFPQPSLLSATFMPELQAQTSSDGIASAGGKKSRRKKKKAKQASTNIQAQTSNLPMSQVPPITMTQ